MQSILPVCYQSSIILFASVGSAINESSNCALCWPEKAGDDSSHHFLNWLSLFFNRPKTYSHKDLQAILIIFLWNIYQCLKLWCTKEIFLNLSEKLRYAPLNNLIPKFVASFVIVGTCIYRFPLVLVFLRYKARKIYRPTFCPRQILLPPHIAELKVYSRSQFPYKIKRRYNNWIEWVNHHFTNAIIPTV